VNSLHGKRSEYDMVWDQRESGAKVDAPPMSAFEDMVSRTRVSTSIEQ